MYKSGITFALSHCVSAWQFVLEPTFIARSLPWAGVSHRIVRSA